MAADVQQGQHQRGEFVPERQACETHARLVADAVDGEGGGAVVAVTLRQADLVGRRDDVLEQRHHFFRLRALVHRRHQLDRLAQVLEVGLELALERGVQHGGILET